MIRGTNEAYEKQLAILDIPPIIRFLHTLKFLTNEVKPEAVKIAKEIIQDYNDSLKVLSDEDLRRDLKKDLQDKKAKYIRGVLDDNATRLKGNFISLREVAFQHLSPTERWDLTIL